MIELKFRAFDKVSKSMSPAFSLFGEFTLLGAVFAWLDHFRGLPDGSAGLLDLNEVEVLQFTGLEDKNGLEIFEGDILQTEIDFGYGFQQVIASVIWKDSGWQFDSEAGCDYGISGRFEVIGNIYQNTELLENKNG